MLVLKATGSKLLLHPDLYTFVAEFIFLMAVKSADGLKTTVREGEQILLRPGGVGGRLSVLR